MALTAARQIILEQASTLEYGAARRGMMSARSSIGLMLDEMAMKARPCDTIVDLLIALSLPSKANDLEAAKARLKEILPPTDKLAAVAMQMALALEDIIQWVHDGEEIDLRAAHDAIRLYKLV